MNFDSNIDNPNSEASGLSEGGQAVKFLIEHAKTEKWSMAKYNEYRLALVEHIHYYVVVARGPSAFFRGYLDIDFCLRQNGDEFDWFWPTQLPPPLSARHEGHNYTICLGIDGLINDKVKDVQDWIDGGSISVPIYNGLPDSLKALLPGKDSTLDAGIIDIAYQWANHRIMFIPAGQAREDIRASGTHQINIGMWTV
jgi:hypothetical protein